VDSVFRVPGVRYCVVIDDYGRKVVGGMKPGVESVSPLDVERKLEMQAVIILKMALPYEKYLGSLHHSTIKWDKLDALFFLLSDDRTLSLTIEGSDRDSAASQVERALASWKKGREQKL
jgi:hypothetical protein